MRGARGFEQAGALLRGAHTTDAWAVGQTLGRYTLLERLGAGGATAGDVLRQLVSDSLRPVAIGLVVGLVAALGVSRVFASLLAGISPHDPLSVGLAIAMLLTGALVAVGVPTRRAAKIDPAGILKES